MNLSLSHDSPINTSFSNSAGQVLYRSETPLKWYGRITRIYKVVPNEYPEDMEDRFEEVARIEWRGPKSSTFRYKGRECLTKDFFRHHGVSGRSVSLLYLRSWLTCIPRRRCFVASDGEYYKWTLGTHGSTVSHILPIPSHLTCIQLELIRSKLPIARSHRRSLNLLKFGKDKSSQPREAFIEILPEGIHILEDVAVTWVFAEILRRVLEAERIR